MLKVIIEYKGIIIKKYFKNINGFKEIRILITDKGNKYNTNYHFICDVKSGSVSIPSTSLIPKESAIINLIFKDKNNEQKTFKIPIHSIDCLGQGISTSFDASIYVDWFN